MFTKKTNKTTKTTTSKKETEKKVEGKKPEIETKDEAFKSLLKDLSKLKGVRGYIVLVDTQTEKEKGLTAGSGINAINGRGDILCNLLGNINPELLKAFEAWKKINSKKEDLDCLENLLKELIRLTKDE